MIDRTARIEFVVAGALALGAIAGLRWIGLWSLGSSPDWVRHRSTSP
jgi:hypothetical protein